MPDTRIFERSAKYLISATRGGPMRAMILQELIKMPLNPNQLALRLGVDYKTIAHHLGVLKKMNWVTSGAEKYGGMFVPTFTPEERGVFNRIAQNLGKSFKTKAMEV